MKIRDVRSIHQLTTGTLLTAANDQLIIAIEMVDAHDHLIDTDNKKELYETLNGPRLWGVDPGYDNVEVYSGSPHGLRLDRILAGREVLTESFSQDSPCPLRTCSRNKKTGELMSAG